MVSTVVRASLNDGGFAESGASLRLFVTVIVGNHRSRNGDELVLHS